jgi:phosphate/sulfate permease
MLALLPAMTPKKPVPGNTHDDAEDVVVFVVVCSLLLVLAGVNESDAVVAEEDDASRSALILAKVEVSLAAVTLILVVANSIRGDSCSRLALSLTEGPPRFVILFSTSCLLPRSSLLPPPVSSSPSLLCDVVSAAVTQHSKNATSANAAVAA